MKCPLCGHSVSTSICEIECGNFDNSTLYDPVCVRFCNHCGHVYNDLDKIDIVGLQAYYNDEYSKINLASTVAIDSPGSKNLFSRNRYDHLLQFIHPEIRLNKRVLDIGCARGGFLDYLRENGMTSLTGIDPAIPYVNSASNSGYIIPGSAEKVPFPENSFDIVVMDQVLEHVANPNLAMQECYRVMDRNGLLLISVPDATMYGSETEGFPFYWLLLREHIQHWDLEHLELLGELNGFVTVTTKQISLPMLSEKMRLPAITILMCKRGESVSPTSLPINYRSNQRIMEYFVSELDRMKRTVQTIYKNVLLRNIPIYCWGIGREFFALWKPYLCTGNIVYLIDNNKFKQENLIVSKRRIYSPNRINPQFKDSAVLITAPAHAEEIADQLYKINYQGKIFTI